MGIHGIYQEIGKGQRISLLKYAIQTYEKENRPLRIAIDTSIWLFQIQASKGGTNPALRTFYYRLLRLTSHAINPIFVFDGPNKPPFKRNKRTGPNVASIPEFLAKQLLKMFGFPIHMAPGEAEAECALLQREGIVDAVFTEDVDALMFGSGILLRSWSPEQKSSKVPTHVNLHDLSVIKSGPSGLDRDGMVLVALMSGGDYIPEGIPGCGPKTACEAARAGFGKELLSLKPSDKAGFKAWRDRLNEELHSNKSKYFKRKHTTVVVPDDFPRIDILGYYTHPVVSSAEKLRKLRDSLRWDHEVDFPALREFTGDAFAWVNLEGAKHFVRSLAPAMLVRELRIRAEQDTGDSDDLTAAQEKEALLIKSLHAERKHITTDQTPEIRVGFVPLDIVKIDIDAEPSDDTIIEGDSEAEEDALQPAAAEDDSAPPSTAARSRGPTKYDPSVTVKVWIPDTMVRIGVPLKIQDWEGARQTAAENVRIRQAAKGAPKPATKTKRTQSKAGGMRGGELERFAKHIKPGVSRTSKLGPSRASKALLAAATATTDFDIAPPSTAPVESNVVSLLSSPPATPQKNRQATLDRFMSPRSDARQRDALRGSNGDVDVMMEVGAGPSTRQRRSGFRRIQTMPVELESPRSSRPISPRGSRRPCSPDPELPSPRHFNSKRSKPSPPENNITRQTRTLEVLDLCLDMEPQQNRTRPQLRPSSAKTLPTLSSIRSNSSPPPISLTAMTKCQANIIPTWDPIAVYSSPPASPLLSAGKALPDLSSISEQPPFRALSSSSNLPTLDLTHHSNAPHHRPLTPPEALSDKPLRSNTQPTTTIPENQSLSATTPALRKFIRPRESLPGHFAWTDGTSPEALRYAQQKQLRRDVFVLDLTEGSVPSKRISPGLVGGEAAAAGVMRSSVEHGNSLVDEGLASETGGGGGSAGALVEARVRKGDEGDEPVPAAYSPLVRGGRRSKRMAQNRSRPIATIDLT